MSRHIYSIYKCTNIINGKIYIGYTKNLKQRIYYHTSPKTYGKNISIFHKSIMKYGKENFQWEIIYQSLNKEHCLNEMETYFIKEYNSLIPKGYNMSEGGEGNKIFGWKHSIETKEKIRKGLMGNKNCVGRSGEKHPMYGKSHPNMKAWKSIVKKYIITDPNGISFEIENLNKFCRENNLNTSNILQNKNGTKGYKCKKIN